MRYTCIWILTAVSTWRQNVAGCSTIFDATHSPVSEWKTSQSSQQVIPWLLGLCIFTLVKLRRFHTLSNWYSLMHKNENASETLWCKLITQGFNILFSKTLPSSIHYSYCATSNCTVFGFSACIFFVPFPRNSGLGTCGNVL